MVGKLAACHADFLERPLQRGTLCAQCSLSLTYLTRSSLIRHPLLISLLIPPSHRSWWQMLRPGAPWLASVRSWEEGLNILLPSCPVTSLQPGHCGQSTWGPCSPGLRTLSLPSSPTGPPVPATWGPGIVCTLFRRIYSGRTSPPSLIPHDCLDFLENPFARTIKERIVDSPREVSILCVRVLPSL